MNDADFKLTEGKDAFGPNELVTRAAAYEKVRLRANTCPEAITEDLADPRLTDKLLAFLETRGIVRKPHSEGMFTLVDTNPQQRVPGWVSINYWNQRTGEGAIPKITLYLKLRVSQEARGVEFWPLTLGNGISPADHLPNFRMFKAVVESGIKVVPPVARKVAASDGHITVTWTDLGLGGIRDLPELFTEFAQGNKAVHRLAENDAAFIFRPNPSTRIYVAEPAQPKVFANWQRQLEDYRNSLILP